jgi:hypothetical protein
MRLTRSGLPAIRDATGMQVDVPYGPFRRDDAAEMQVEGLDALENAAGHDCPPADTADA